MTQEFVTLPRYVVEQAQMWIPLLAEIAGLDPETTAAEFSEFADGRPASEFTIAGVITALRAALEQPQVEQGPAWYHKQWSENDNIFYRPIEAVPDGATPLYIHPLPKREPLTKGEQEPVAWLHQCNKRPDLIEMSFRKQEPVLAAKGYKARPLIFGDIAHPQPKREPLTVEQIAAATGAKPGTPTWPLAVAFTRSIEAAHNIK